MDVDHDSTLQSQKPRKPVDPSGSEGDSDEGSGLDGNDGGEDELNADDEHREKKDENQCRKEAKEERRKRERLNREKLLLERKIKVQVEKARREKRKEEEKAEKDRKKEEEKKEKERRKEEVRAEKKKEQEQLAKAKRNAKSKGKSKDFPPSRGVIHHLPGVSLEFLVVCVDYSHEDQQPSPESVLMTEAEVDVEVEIFYPAQHLILHTENCWTDDNYGTHFHLRSR
jgi:outer membrane biosynthesis protein TonB